MKSNKKPASVPVRKSKTTLAAANRVKPKTSMSSRKIPALPPLLLEGDAPASAVPAGPGQRYSTAPGAVSSKPTVAGELPESYGTETLLLTARDPYWVYAHWDLDRRQLRQYNSLSADGHMVLRVYQDSVAGKPLQEIHVHPESRSWFVPVGRAGTRFIADLGYYAAGGRWASVAVSRPTLTPPDRLSDDLSARFATLPLGVSFEQLVQQVEVAIRENAPLADAVLEARARGQTALPDSKRITEQPWTPAQQRALAKIVNLDEVRRIWVGSLEITELIRRQMAEDLYSAAASQFGRSDLWSGAVSSLSSPAAGPEQEKAFWFNVNAELIVYGATEPDAQVTIGKRSIKLRPDGSFSYRFALPDGNYELPITAVSEDGTDERRARLQFTRQTEYRGDVGAHPQAPHLKRPHVDHVR